MKEGARIAAGDADTIEIVPVVGVEAIPATKVIDGEITGQRDRGLLVDINVHDHKLEVGIPAFVDEPDANRLRTGPENPPA